jgi:glutathione S-transferase
MLLHDLTPGMHPRRVRIFLAEKGLSIPRRQALATMRWLDREFASRQHLVDDACSLADIVAQCAFVLAKAVGLRIPPEMAYPRAGSRPPARGRRPELEES